MANLIHPTPQFGFRTAGAGTHSPAPLGFGFGLSSAAALPGWQPQPMQSLNNHPNFGTTSPHYSSSKAGAKRRLEDADEDMDRSPTPEKRPMSMRRIVPKRGRIGEAQSQGPAAENDKENRTPQNAQDDIDVGVLLASLPTSSLLPVITSLLQIHPTLRSEILQLIPRPALDTALNALGQANRQIREAYPYSSSTSFSTSFGFGDIRGPAGAALSPNTFSRPGNQQSHSSGMRDSYIISRLRPHIDEYASTALSYAPYFSFLPTSSQAGKDKVHANPVETFQFLFMVTDHLRALPPLAQSSLSALLFPRLIEEWMAWVDRIDTYVNKEAGMFGSEVAQGWIRSLDEFADANINGIPREQTQGFKAVRDKWIAKVGWLAGRRETHAMEEEEEEL